VDLHPTDRFSPGHHIRDLQAPRVLP
jgi:hypothetical protein